MDKQIKENNLRQIKQKRTFLSCQLICLLSVTDLIKHSPETTVHMALPLAQTATSDKAAASAVLLANRTAEWLKIRQCYFTELKLLQQPCLSWRCFHLNKTYFENVKAFQVMFQECNMWVREVICKIFFPLTFWHFKLHCWLASNKPITEADICGMKAFNFFHITK